MFKKLDIFIIKKFLGTFFFALILLLVIAIVIDIVERIDDFMEANVSLSIIITNYYLPFIPWISGILFPLFVFISVLFFTSQMASRSEIVGIIGSGVSFYRILVPYIVTSVLLAIMLFYGNHYLIPWSNAKKLSFENTYFHNGYKESAQNLHMKLNKNDYIFLVNYNHAENEGYKFSFEHFDNGILTYKLRCDKIEWDYTNKNWNLYNVKERTMNGLQEKLVETAIKKGVNYGFKPDDFEVKLEIKEAMNTNQMNEFLQREELRGADNLESFYVEKLRRTTEPISLIILTIIGFAIASRKTRGGMGIHLAFGLGLSALYVLLMKMNTTFASQAGLNPYVALWMPNILFAFIAIYLLKIAQK